MNLIFVGPPGAGKGTQAKLVCQKHNIPHISTGDMLRAAIREGSQMGLKAKSYIDVGDLVPDEVVIGIVKERLAMDDCKKGFVLDGFPRTVTQAKELDTITSINKVIMVDVYDEKLVSRIAGRRSCAKCPAIYHITTYSGATCDACGGEITQRVDDQEATVRNRLKVYHQKTAPLVEYYRSKSKISIVDGDRDIQEVFEDICTILKVMV